MLEQYVASILLVHCRLRYSVFYSYFSSTTDYSFVQKCRIRFLQNEHEVTVLSKTLLHSKAKTLCMHKIKN